MDQSDSDDVGLVMVAARKHHVNERHKMIHRVNDDVNVDIQKSTVNGPVSRFGKHLNSQLARHKQHARS